MILIRLAIASFVHIPTSAYCRPRAGPRGIAVKRSNVLILGMISVHEMNTLMNMTLFPSALVTFYWFGSESLVHDFYGITLFKSNYSQYRQILRII